LPKSCIFKIIMAGAYGSGKTAFLNGTYYPFSDNEYFQIGVSFKLIDCLINNEDSCLLQCWDLNTNSVLKSLYPSFCKGAKGALLFFDVTDRSSFKELHYWINTIKNMAGNIPIILVGKKTELKDQAISNDKINEIIEKDKLNGIYFTSNDDNNREEIIKHLLETMRYSQIYRLSILLPEYDNDFEGFIKTFSVCPICNRKNHYNYLKRFYFSKSHDTVRLKECLLKLVEKSKDFNDIYYNKINIGIPCCKCFKQYITDKN